MIPAIKSAGRSSEALAKIVGCCERAVKDWLKGYEAAGIEGLHTQAGPGRKAILDEATDDATIKEVGQANRQRLGGATAAWQEALEKQFSQRGCKRIRV
jgi:transposase